MDEQALEALDGEGYTVLDALAHVRAPQRASLSTPHLFTCVDGRGYWVKATSQHGLVTELVAGRLAERVGAGPPSAIVRVAQEAAPSDGSANHLVGVHVGSRDRSGSVNDRELDLLGITALDPQTIVPAQRALVVAFQTWVGEGDLQLLIDLRSGKVFSFDHGDCFGDTSALVDPTLAVHPLPGIPDDHGSDAKSVADAVSQVESITDGELLEAVARVPAWAPWQSDRVRRLGIAKWLSHRRDRLGEVMKTW